MYPSTSIFIAIGQLAIAILVMFSYPLQVHPCRNCLDKVFHFGGGATKQVLDGEEQAEDEHGPTSDMSPFKHIVLTVMIVVSGFVIAYFVNDLQMGTIFRIHCPSISFPLTRIHSVVIRGIHRVDDHLIHTTWFLLLEGRDLDLTRR